MGKKKRNQEVDELPVPEMARVPQVVAAAPLPIPERLHALIEKVINEHDVELTTMEKSGDASMLLSLDALRQIVLTGEDDAKIAAANAITNISNHIVRRRKLSLESKKSIVVNISPDLAIKSARGTNSDE